MKQNFIMIVFLKKIFIPSVNYIVKNVAYTESL